MATQKVQKLKEDAHRQALETGIVEIVKVLAEVREIQNQILRELIEVRNDALPSASPGRFNKRRNPK